MGKKTKSVTPEASPGVGPVTIQLTDEEKTKVQEAKAVLEATKDTLVSATLQAENAESVAKLAVERRAKVVALYAERERGLMALVEDMITSRGHSTKDQKWRLQYGTMTISQEST